MRRLLFFAFLCLSFSALPQQQGAQPDTVAALRVALPYAEKAILSKTSFLDAPLSNFDQTLVESLRNESAPLAPFSPKIEKVYTRCITMKALSARYAQIQAMDTIPYYPGYDDMVAEAIYNFYDLGQKHLNTKQLAEIDSLFYDMERYRKAMVTLREVVDSTEIIIVNSQLRNLGAAANELALNDINAYLDTQKEKISEIQSLPYPAKLYNQFIDGINADPLAPLTPFVQELDKKLAPKDAQPAESSLPTQPTDDSNLGQTNNPEGAADPE